MDTPQPAGPPAPSLGARQLAAYVSSRAEDLARVGHTYSAETLAVALGVSSRAVRRWLSGERVPLLPMRERLAGHTRGAVAVDAWGQP